MFALAVWVLLSLVGGVLTLWAVWARSITRWRSTSLLGFLAWILVSGGGLMVAQGWSSSCSLLLPGKYDMIGFLPVPDEKIYLFLNTEYGPKTCDLPWDAGTADELKKQQEGNGTELVVEWGPAGEGAEGSGIPGIDDSIAQPWAKPPTAETPPKPEEEGALF